MYITFDSIIKAAEVVGSIGCLVGIVVTLVKFVQRDKQQSQIIAKMQNEQKIICYGLKGALQGLIEAGCNGPCKDALHRLEKHLNNAAHEANGGEDHG